TADGGGFAISLASGTAGGSTVAGSAGAGVADNEIGQDGGHSIKAYIDHADVTATTGDVTVSATSSAIIDAVSMAGSLAAARGANTTLAFSLAGAFSFNTIGLTVEADIVDHAVIHATAGSVKLTANDYSEVTANGGGIALAFAQSTGGSA